MPLNVVTGTDPIPLGYTKSYYKRPDRDPDVPLYLEGPQYPGAKAMNPGAFAAVTTSFQGNVARNSLRGFGVVQQDLSMQRNLGLSDRFSTHLRAEILNVAIIPTSRIPARVLHSDVLNAARFGFTSMSLSQSLVRERRMEASTRSTKAAGPGHSAVLKLRFLVTAGHTHVVRTRLTVAAASKNDEALAPIAGLHHSSS